MKANTTTATREWAEAEAEAEFHLPDSQYLQSNAQAPHQVVMILAKLKGLLQQQLRAMKFSKFLLRKWLLL